MSFFKSVGILLRLVEYIEKLIKRLQTERRKSELIEGKDEAIASRDQKFLEDKLGVSGKPTEHEYPGMLTRERKDRE